MACRLVKEHIRPLRWVGQGSMQTAVEGAVMTGESSVQLVTAEAEGAVQLIEVKNDGIAVQGTAEFAVLYLDTQGQLRSDTAQNGFAAVIPVEGAAAGQQAQVKATVTGVTVVQRGGRLEMTAQLLLCGAVTEETQLSAAVDAASDEELAKKYARLQTLSTAAAQQSRERLSETVPIAQEGMQRVVWSKPHAEITYTQAMDGAAEVTGVTVMYFGCGRMILFSSAESFSFALPACGTIQSSRAQSQAEGSPPSMRAAAEAIKRRIS